MPLTISDPATLAALASATEPCELRGPDGKLLGIYQPAIPGMSVPESGMTDDEIRRLINRPDGWVTADQVDARLRELEGNA